MAAFIETLDDDEQIDEWSEERWKKTTAIEMAYDARDF